MTQANHAGIETWLAAALLFSGACSEPGPTIVASDSGKRGASVQPISPMTLDSEEAREHRLRLVAEIRRRGRPWPGIEWDPHVLEAMSTVPRHMFVPELSLAAAYRDAPQPIGLGQTISQPTVVAMMAQALELTSDSEVLEIGTGSGYAAAVVAKLARHVYTIEIHEPLANSARIKLAAAGHANVTVRAGDGYAGWPEHAPFDRIVLTAAPERLPSALVEQLAVGGVLVAPVGPEGELQRLHRHRKLPSGALTSEDLGAVMFVPMVHGDD